MKPAVHVRSSPCADESNTSILGTRTVLTNLFSASAVVVDAPIALVDDQLLPEEWAYIRHAVPNRRAEFGTARVCARKGLEVMGYPISALVPRADRTPTWPPGVVGSISHTDGYSAVVLHRSPPVRSLGLDVETLQRLDDPLLGMILTPSERTWLASRPRGCRDDLAMLFFSAKEAYYKCQYPLSTTFLDFQDVELEIDLSCNRFDAHAKKLLAGSGARLAGRFAFDSGRVLCGVEAKSSRDTE